MEYEKWDEVLAPYNNAVEELKVKFQSANSRSSADILLQYD